MVSLSKPKLGTFKKFGEDYPKPKCSYCGKEARWLKAAGMHRVNKEKMKIFLRDYKLQTLLK